MKNKKIKRISIVLSILLLFNSLGMFASDTASQDEVIDSSLTEQTENIVLNSTNTQARMGKYYSDYGDAAYYDGDNELRFRTSSYGYAFRMFYAMDECPSRFGNYYYEQQPGEFAYKRTPIQIQLTSSESYSLSNYQDVDDLLFRLFTSHFNEYTTSQKFNAILTLVQADAATLGYTLTECTGSIPNATTYSNRRMIAIVAGPQYYHFYMQHSDNTWSHKLGHNPPTNYCNCDEDSGGQVILNNSNIEGHACDGAYYEGGMVKFYYITKNAIVDYKHIDGTAENSVRTRTITTDLAGNTRYAAKDIGSLPEDYLAGGLDYPGDVDFYGIYTSNSGNHTIRVQSSSDYLLQICVYDSSGEFVAFNTAVSSSSLTVYLEIDAQYYISVYSPNFLSYEYDFTYTLE